MYNTDLPTRAELPTSRQLLRSTLIAAAVAGLLLVGVVMPAEYGRDPLGTGRLLGLTQMGEIKVALAQEAAADQVAPTAASEAAPTPVPAPAPSPAPTGPAVAQATPPAPAPATPATPQPATGKVAQDVTTVTLQPGQAAEVKLAMRKDAEVRFEWIARGGPVNYDNHGDPVHKPKGFYHGYGKGRGVERDAGVLKAAFDGTHGFFWRNRGQGPVTIELRTQGDYTAIKRVL